MLKWIERPELHRPIIIAAFGGWNDAGECATNAVDYLCKYWQALKFASIDPEIYFDFSENRPMVRLDNGMRSAIDWPQNDFFFVSRPSVKRDIIFLQGNEPQLRWKTFCHDVTTVARDVKAELVLTLGGLLTDVPHTRPAHITATASSSKLLTDLNAIPSSYEGPTGIIGVLQDACHSQGFASGAFWVAVPHYASQMSSPKGTLALVERIATYLNVEIDTADLQLASTNYEADASEVVANDPELAQYVAELEVSDDARRSGADNLAAEAERFLRDQND